MTEWSNRVIGYQDPDYASSAEFDPSGATPMAREAMSLRPEPGPDGRMPDPRSDFQRGVKRLPIAWTA